MISLQNFGRNFKLGDSPRFASTKISPAGLTVQGVQTRIYAYEILKLVDLAKEAMLCYNIIMSDIDIYTPTDTDLIDAPGADPNVGVKRMIADALRKAGTKEMYVAAIGKKVPYKDYLAMMLWDVVTNGEFLFADGAKITISDYAEWLSTVKFLSNHLDGNAGSDVNVGVNVFKVYMGIDTDRV